MSQHLLSQQDINDKNQNARAQPMGQTEATTEISRMNISDQINSAEPSEQIIRIIADGKLIEYHQQICFDSEYRKHSRLIE